MSKNLKILYILIYSKTLILNIKKTKPNTDSKTHTIISPLKIIMILNYNIKKDVAIKNGLNNKDISKRRENRSKQYKHNKEIRKKENMQYRFKDLKYKIITEVGGISRIKEESSIKLIQNFKSDNYPHIILDSYEIEMLFYAIKRIYQKLASLLKEYQEQMIYGFYNYENYYLFYEIVDILTKWAKIAPANRERILQGAQKYVYVLQREQKDLTSPDFVVSEPECLTYLSFINDFHHAVKKLLRKGGPQQAQGVSDLYPQAPGKDTTNEINYSIDPFSQPKEKENETREGDILDKIRNRDSKFKAGAAGYDYNYSKLGFNIELEKAPNSYDLTKEYAHQTATAQIIKSYVLTICSNHFVNVYKRYEMGSEDKIHRDSHIVINMKTDEINPYIRRFNSEVAYNQVKNNLNRYNQGLTPNIQKFFKLDYIDESQAKYYQKYSNLYAQLSPLGKLKFNEIIEIKGKLYELVKYNFYKDFIINLTELETQNNTPATESANNPNKQTESINSIATNKILDKKAKEIIKANKELTAKEIQNIICDYLFQYHPDTQTHEYEGNTYGDGGNYYGKWYGIRATARKINDSYLEILMRVLIKEDEELKDYNVAGKYYKINATYTTEAKDYEIKDNIIKVRYLITFKHATTRGKMQDKIPQLEAQLKKELVNIQQENEHKNIDKLLQQGYI